MSNLPPLVSIVIVNYNGIKFIKDCCNSLLALNYPVDKLEIIMVDNGSTDDSVSFVKQKYPRVNVLPNDVNNYARANNLGIKHAKGKFIALINNDVIVEKDWLIRLVECINQDERIGAVGSKILFMDGSIQSVGHQEYPNFYWGDIGFGDKDSEAYGIIKEVVSICGCSVLYRTSCLKDVGPLDEDFNIFIEDVDMGIRCRKNGWKLLICPPSVIYHKFHSTVENESNARHRQEENRLILIAKHWPEKLADALSGKDYFTIKNGYASDRDISNILGRVFVKLIKEHGLEYTNKISPDLFAAVRRIYNCEKDYLIQEVSCKNQEISIGKEQLASLRQGLESLKQQLVFQEQQLVSLRQGLESFKQQLAFKEQQLAFKEQQLVFQEQQLASLRQGLESFKQQLAFKEQQLAFKEQQLVSLRQELEQRDLELNSNKLLLQQARKELNDIYASTGYRYILKPLWDYLWSIKNNYKRAIRFISTKRINLRFNYSRNSNILNKLFKILKGIKNHPYPFVSRYLLKSIYLNHLKFETFPLRPRSLSLMIIKKCNLKCEFCDIPREKYGTEIMRKEDAFNIINSAEKLGVKYIELTGGEPLLHPELFEIADFINAKNMKAVLSTNGLLVKSNIEKIVASKFAYINISVDGEEPIHDDIRNHKGAHKIALEAVNLIKHHGINTAISFVVTNKNIYDLEKVYNYFLSLGIRMSFFPVINKPHLFLSGSKQINIYLAFIRDLFRRRLLSREDYGYLKNAALAYFLGNDFSVRCLGLNTRFSVDTDGAISPCCVWSNKKDEISNLGNIFIENIEELWFSPKFHEARLSIFHEGCKGCFNPWICELEKLTGLPYLIKKNSEPRIVPKPNHVHFRFTSRCNLSCRHCDIWKNNGKYNFKNELSAEQWKGAVDKLSAWLGKFRLDIAGGEILLYKGALDIIEYCARKGISAGLTTNATLIDSGVAERLSSSGLYAINLSLDGLASTHEYTRNQKNIYSKVEQAALDLLKYRKSNNPYIAIATVITKYNLGELENMVKLVDKWGINGITFQVLDQNFGAKYNHNWFKNNEFWPKDRFELEAAIDNLIHAKKTGAKIYNSIEQLNDMRVYYRDPAGALGRVCASGDINFIVDEYGGTHLCWNTESLGNILKQDPKGIWDGKLASRKRKEIYKCLRTCRVLNCNYGI